MFGLKEERGKETTSPMVSEHSQSQFSVNGTDSKDFTSDSDDDEPKLDEGGRNEKLVSAICCEGLSK